MNGAFIQEQQGLGLFSSGQMKEKPSHWQSPVYSPQTPATLVVKDHVNGVYPSSHTAHSPSVMLNVRPSVRSRTQMETQGPVTTRATIPMSITQRGVVDGFEQPPKKVRYFDISEDLSSSSQQRKTPAFTTQPMRVGTGCSPVVTQTVSLPLAPSQSYYKTALDKPVLTAMLPVVKTSCSSITTPTPTVAAKGKAETDATGAKDTGSIKPVYLDESLVPVLPSDAEIDFDDIVFDCFYYYDHYSDVRAQCGQNSKKLKEHWERTGIDSGKMCSPVLDLSFLITRLPPELQTRQTNYRTAYKYLSKIIKAREYKQLASSRLYDPELYVKRYPQLKKYTPLQLIYHYMSIGRFHNLNASTE